jgi:hypothetical protein
MEPSSKLKALKFMQRRPGPSSPSLPNGNTANQTSPPKMDNLNALEESRAKLAAGNRWTLSSSSGNGKEREREGERAVKVVYEQSGGPGNRCSHQSFHDFRRPSQATEEPVDAGRSSGNNDGINNGGDAVKRKHVRLAEQLDPCSQRYRPPTPPGPKRDDYHQKDKRRNDK